MEAALHEIVLSRLRTEQFLDEAAKHLVMMACEGEGFLQAALDESYPDSPIAFPKAAAESPVRAFLASISVEGFRGIGPKTTLRLRPGSGLTLVIGRNGSGKSSFAEAFEILLTGDNRRWSSRSSVWKEGWRNLHHPKACIEASLVVEGDKGPAIATRRWDDTEKDVSRSSVEVQRTGRQKDDLNSFGWRDVVTTYRPFLSYNELGSMLDEGPAKLYDALSTVLGLGDVIAAQESLRQSRLVRERTVKEASEALDLIRPKIEACYDPRAQACREALKGKKWNLQTVEDQVIAGTGSPSTGGDVGRLQQVAVWQAPTADVVNRIAGEVTSAAEQVAKVAAGDSGQALQIADLLDRALRFHQDHGDGNCPVCGRSGALGPVWRTASLIQVERLRATAREAESADRRLADAMADARSLLTPVPEFIRAATGLGIDMQVSAAVDEWQAWAKGPEGSAAPLAIARHLTEQIESVTEATNALRKAATEELARREDLWRPVAIALTEWLGSARQATEQSARVRTLKAAEQWLKEASSSIRDERFEPLADAATKVWEALRTQSNIELKRISLAGASTQRKVTLDVTVDGVGGAALGVMSQGELHSLALSLFLPKATVPESPFGFIVIDDPVQSMDPARVECLAKVLHNVAQSRQVIVFTHDDRLPEACRRLQIEAHMIEVTRREGSMVELRTVSDPVQRYLEDARAIASTPALSEPVVARVSGAFCRLAIEAACTEVVLRRRLGRGESHLGVAALLDDAEKLSEKAALALFDDPARAGDVLGRLRQIRPWAADAYQAANKGAHGALSVAQLKNVVDSTLRLTQRLAAIR